MSGPDGDWLDVARIHTLVTREPGWKSDRSVRLVGLVAEGLPVDSASNRRPGYISVVGIWRDESIEVEAVSAETPAPEPRALWREPPCPPPPGGWRRGVVELDIDLRGLEPAGEVVHPVIFRPSEDQEVLVVAATDVDAVTRLLAPKLPGQFCVVPSRFTRAQIDEVYDVLHAHWREWRIESFGTGSDAQAQPFIPVSLFRVTTDTAEWADTLPEGLVRLDPTLSPA
ncbi:hypothetical protein ACQPYH_13135 [Kribbella sp. CA-245084]|uniref:hypothetical protein n=1 Tax=Kribbella sp. CA-245084 TaxID=3239940 RepID=UPI003D89D090